MDQQFFYLAVVFLALEFTGVNAIRCQVCTYSEMSSDDSFLHSLVSSSSGSSSCWGTDTTLMGECSSIYTACGTVRADMTLEVSTLLGSGNLKMRTVTKTCSGNVGSDTCASEDLSSYLSTLAVLSGYSTSGSGEVTACICHTDGCNHGNVVRATSISVFLAFTMAALVHLIYN